MHHYCPCLREGGSLFYSGRSCAGYTYFSCTLSRHGIMLCCICGGGGGALCSIVRSCAGLVPLHCASCVRARSSKGGTPHHWVCSCRRGTHWCCDCSYCGATFRCCVCSRCGGTIFSVCSYVMVEKLSRGVCSCCGVCSLFGSTFCYLCCEGMDYHGACSCDRGAHCSCVCSCWRRVIS